MDHGLVLIASCGGPAPAPTLSQPTATCPACGTSGLPANSLAKFQAHQATLGDFEGLDPVLRGRLSGTDGGGWTLRSLLRTWVSAGRPYIGSGSRADCPLVMEMDWADFTLRIQRAVVRRLVVQARAYELWAATNRGGDEVWRGCVLAARAAVALEGLSQAAAGARGERHC